MNRRRATALGAIAAATVATVLLVQGPLTRVKPLRLCNRQLITIVIGETRFCSHGGDPDDATVSRGSALCLFCVKPPATTTPPSFSCAASGQKAVQMIYAHPADRSDLYDSWRGPMISAAASMDVALPNRRIRWVCSGDQPSIVRLTVTSVGSDGVFSFSDYLKSVKDSGRTSSSRAYMAFVSGVAVEYPYGGQATIDDDDQPGLSNVNNVGPMYSMVDRLTWTGALHELGHNLGAVQCSAPHSSCDGRTGHHHCWDENDIMCYADGTSHAMVRVCDVSTPLFDCKMDDYFNPAPARGSYLDVNWNLARSSFLVVA